MKPVISTFDLILNAAKNAASVSIAKRDADSGVVLENVTVRVIDTAKRPWILFEVLIIYHANDASLEPNDDLSILVPWNSETNALGEIKGKSF
jgi:hypothetical protein